MNTLQERLRANPLPLPNVMELCREAADRIDALETENAALRADAERYRELIMLVGNKYPDESRHDTARRYLINAEKNDNTAAIDAARSKT